MFRFVFGKKSLLLVLVITLVSCGGAEDRKIKYLEKGKELLQNNNLDKARIEFKNVLQIDPKSAEGYFYMAQTNERLKQYQQALGGYLKAIELNPDYIEAKAAAGRIYLLAGAADKAIEYADQILAIAANDVDALVVRAGGLYRKGQTDAALRDVRMALDIQPDHVASIALLSRIYLSQGQADKAEALVRSAVEYNKQDEGLVLLLVQLYEDSKQYAKAANELENLIGLHPQSMGLRSKLAAFYIALQDDAKAEQVLRTAVKELPDEVDAKRALIQYLAEKRDLMFAQLEVSRFIKDDPNNPELQLVSARLYEKTKDYDKAETIYRDIIKKYADEPSSPSARYALANMFLAMGNIEESKNELNQLLKKHPVHNDGLIMHGLFALDEKDADTAVSDFRSVLKEQPASVRVMKLLAQAYVLANQNELAQEQLKSALKTEPTDFEARMMLAKMLLQQNQFSRAEEQLALLTKLKPDNLDARELLIKSYLAQKKYSEATTLANQLEKAFPDMSMGYFFNGMILQVQNENLKSLEKYDQALEKSPKAVEPLASYVRAALAANKSKPAIERLKKTLDQSPEHLVAQNLLGEVYLHDRKYTAAVESFDKAIALNKAWWIPYRNLAASYRMQKQDDKAIEIYQQGIAAAEQKDQLVFELASLFESQGRIDQAIKVYEDLLAAMPKSVMAANNLALLLANHRDDKPDLDRALSLVDDFQSSENAYYLDTLGWVYFKRGELDKALSVLLRANQKAPQVPVINYHLGSVYFSKGDMALARKYLEPVVGQDSRFREKQDAERMLSEISQQAG